MGDYPCTQGFWALSFFREKLHEEVSDAEVALMRQAIAGEQQQQVLEKGNAC